MAWPHTRHLLGTLFLVVAVAPQAYQSPPLKTISIASERFVVDPAKIVLASTTLSAAGPAVTMDGVVMSEDSNKDLFVDGVEVLIGPTHHVPTTSSSLSKSKFESEFRFVGVSCCIWLR